MNKKNLGKGILVATLAVGTILGGLVAAQPSFAAKTTQAQTQQDHAKLLKQTMQLAKQGKVKTSGKFGLSSTRKSIETKWGKADTDSQRGQLKYSKRATIFEVADWDGHKDSVFLLQTTDKSYANVTYQEVKKAFGKGSEYKGADGGYISYQAGDNVLNFNFHADKKGNLTKIKNVEVTLP